MLTENSYLETPKLLIKVKPCEWAKPKTIIVSATWGSRDFGMGVAKI